MTCTPGRHDNIIEEAEGTAWHGLPAAAFSAADKSVPQTDHLCRRRCAHTCIR